MNANQPRLHANWLVWALTWCALLSDVKRQSAFELYKTIKYIIINYESEKKRIHPDVSAIVSLPHFLASIEFNRLLYPYYLLGYMLTTCV